MTFIAKVNDVGSFTAVVNGSVAFDVTVKGEGAFNATMGVIGPEGASGIITVQEPLIYDSVLKDLSIDLSDYATIVYVNEQIANVEVDLTGYATETWVLDKGYITSSALTPYITSATAASTYYPLTNPTGYITSSALTPYLLSTTAASTYQPIGSYATTTQLSDGLAGKANTTHTHDASAIVTGVIDIARIPIIPSQVQVVSTQNSIANLTAGEQAQITGSGVLVTTTDGSRWVYSGSGSKTDQASYVKVADITPDWTEVANKPFFGTASGSDITDFAPAGWNPFDQTLNKEGNVEFASVKTDAIQIKSLNANLNFTVYNDTGAGTYYTSYFNAFGGGLVLSPNSTGITFPDATVQNTAYTGQNIFDQSLNTTDAAQFGRVQVLSGDGSSGAITADVGIINTFSVTNGISGIAITPSGITFENLTFQSTALPSGQLANTVPVWNATSNVWETGGSSDIRFFNDQGDSYQNGIRPSTTGCSEFYAKGFDTTTNTEEATAYFNAQTFNISTTHGDISLWAGGSIDTQISIESNYGTTDLFQTKLYAGAVEVLGQGNRMSMGTGGLTFPDNTVQTTAYTGGGDFLPLAGGTMTGNITFGDAGQYIGKGTFDTSRGGGYGISLVCSVGYEFNWQAGWLTTTEQNSTTPRPLYLDSVAGTTLRVWDSANGYGTEVAHNFVKVETYDLGSPRNVEIKTDKVVGQYGIYFNEGSVSVASYTQTGITLRDSSGSVLASYKDDGITFPDGTTQNTAGQSFDQSLNTTNDVNFNTVNAIGGLGSFIGADDYSNLTGATLTLTNNLGFLQINGAGITFPDSTVQTRAYPFEGTVASDIEDGLRWAQMPSVGNPFATIGDLPDISTKLDKPLVDGLDGQILSTDGVNNIWIDNRARTLFATVRNETGAPLAKGTIVYISGAAGNKALVSKAIATSDPTSAGTFAVIAETIANNNNGTAIVAGELIGLDTFGIAEGSSLYLSPTVAGTWTTTKPTAPNHIVFIGTVVRAHQTQGAIEIRIQNGYELEELHDVSVLDRADGDILRYDDATSLWKSNTIPEVLGYTPISRVVDVNDTQAGIRITQTGTGEAFRVEDSTSPDSSPFVINNAGNVGIGTAPTANKLTVSGASSFTSASFTSISLSTSGYFGCGNNFFSLDGVALNQAGSYILFPDNTTQTTAWTGQNIFNQSLNTSDQVEFNTITLQSPIGNSIYISPSSITFDDDTVQTHAYPFMGTVAAAIEGGLLNANSPSSTNAFATLGDVESSVNAYAASVTPVLPTSDEKAALSGANTPSSSNPFLTSTDVPAASTTAAGKVELATSAEVIAGTNTTLAVTPATLAALSSINKFSEQYLSNYGNWTSGVAGGMTNRQASTERAININSTTAISSALLYQYGFLTNRGQTQSSGIDWSKRVIWTMRMLRYAGTAPSAGCVFRTGIGKTQAGIAVGDLINRGIGVRIQGSGALELQVHNGTSLTNITSSFTPVSGSVFDISLISDGAGNVELYVNDLLVASSSNGPTSSATFLWNTYFEVQQTSAVAVSAAYGFVNCRATFFE